MHHARCAVMLSLAILLGPATACLSPPEEPPAGIATREEGWLRGDLHLHTTHSDGEDPVAIVIALAEYLEDPVFLKAHPEYRGSGLDFIAITDHRTVAVGQDPDFRSDRLVLLLGEEFGGPGHAGRIGVTEHVPHDPYGTGATLEIYQAAVDAAHAEGGIFSLNHPFHQSNPFHWDIRNHDAIEVWNAGWALVSAPFTEENLQEWEEARGPAAPMFRRAVKDHSGGASMQSLIFYEAQLARGIHVAIVGGSDRHQALPVGFPTTWVLAPSQDEYGVLEGIRSRHTFVSRTPASTQILMHVESAERSYIQGDSITIPEAGAHVSILLRAARGEGGLLQLVCGTHVPTDDELWDAPLGEVVFEELITSWEFEAVVMKDVSPGDWCYARVFDQLIAPGLTDEQADMVQELAEGAAATGQQSYGFLLNVALKLVEPLDLLFEAYLCDPKDWNLEIFQCMPPDDNGMATFFVPDHFDRALNVITENGVPTEWSMGALASAVMFVAE